MVNASVVLISKHIGVGNDPLPQNYIWERWAPTQESIFMMGLVEKWGMATAHSASTVNGTERYHLVPVSEVVKRASEMTDEVFTEMKRKGYLLDAGTLEDAISSIKKE